MAIGWEAPTLNELDSVRRKVGGYGLAFSEGMREDMADRKVEALFRFSDVDGFPIEIYYGPWMDAVPFQPSRPMSGFQCGQLGIGHVVLVSKDTARAARFYQDILGFLVTDYITSGDMHATFHRAVGQAQQAAGPEPNVPMTPRLLDLYQPKVSSVHA